MPACLKTLLQYDACPVRILHDNGNGAACLQFAVTVPDHLEQIVILDASAQINRLVSYDEKIRVLDPELAKDYANVTIRFAGVPSSRTHLSRHIDDGYLDEVRHILENEIPAAEEVVIFTLKDRQGENYAKRIEELVPGSKRGKVHVTTWGHERGINHYHRVKYGLNVGMVYRDKNELRGAIVRVRPNRTVHG